jgi:hypothetical protein
MKVITKFALFGLLGSFTDAVNVHE